MHDLLVYGKNILNEKRGLLPYKTVCKICFSPSISVNGNASTRCSMVDGEVQSQVVIDYSSEFTTYEVFKSRDALSNWARNVGKMLGFVIVISKSDVTSRATARLSLGCERGGHYKETQKNSSKSLINEGKRRKTGTKKCGCPFLLKGVKMPTEDEWMLTVVNGVHNHPAAEYLEGHSYAGRLSCEENSLVVDMSKSMARPKDILTTLKQHNALNKSTMRTVYNARAKYRVKEKAGRSQMQFLLGKLDEYKYIEWHMSTDETETLTDLIWAHPQSLDLLGAFPRVLIMDCTYKTNRFRLPLLEIVGVTSTDLTFSIAFAYLTSEREDNYKWALSIVRSLMDDRGIAPAVIITDRELSLLNAIEKVFPNANHMLCRWHISKNIMSKCKKMFAKGHWEKFISLWNVLVLSDTEFDYNHNLTFMLKDFEKYPEALDYIQTSWLIPYRFRFVSAWTDKYLHYGNTTSNRAESAHARLKRQLGCSTMNFETSWPHIHNLIELQITKIKASFEKSLTTVQHHFKSPELRHLRGLISLSALENILDNRKLANSVGIDVSMCGCANRRTHGLPCAHEIAEYIRDGRSIPIESIDPHWMKLDMLPAPTMEDGKLSCQAEFDLIAKRFMENDRVAQLDMLKKLREIARPESTHLLEPDISKVKPRGRPKLKIETSTRRNPSAFEYVTSGQGSHSPTSNCMKPHGIKMLKIPKIQNTNSASNVPYMTEFPARLQEYINHTIDVKSDGNCGFRAIAALIDYGEHEWKRVRDDLMTELQTHSELYARLYGSDDRVAELSTIIGNFDEYPGSEYWMTMPDMGHIIASKYSVVLYHLSNVQCLTFLPLHSAPVLPFNRKEIAIGFVNCSHFIQVFLKSGHPVPPIAGNWTKHHLSPLADGWALAYKDRIQKFKEIIDFNVIISETIELD